MSIKSTLKATPVVGSLLQHSARRVQRTRFPGSADYWERRYREGGNSGAGSYGETAKFKASVINALVAERGVSRVVEFGCGDGAQLSLASYPTYIGLDVSATIIRQCIARFRGDHTKSFIAYSPNAFVNNGAVTGEMALSLDVILHLVEDAVLQRYLEDLSRAATEVIVVFTEDRQPAATASHVRFRNVSDWSSHLSGWRLAERIDNPHKGPDGVADFFVFEREDAEASI